jgi:hypothetical protein
MKEHQYPWAEPAGVRSDLGPAQLITFEVAGVTLQVVPTNKFGCDTRRRRYRVECLTCNELLHAATTSPRAYLDPHLNDVHKLGET